MSDRLLVLTELSLVDGPIELPDLAYSFADNWKPELYTADEIAAAISSVPNVHVVHGADPDWEAWDARWELDGNFIHFDIIECPIHADNSTRPGLTSYWGGSKFETSCTMQQLLDVWRRIQSTCPGVWLHDTDCRMYSPESFAAAFGS